MGVYQVVAPAIQLVAGGRRSILEGEKGPVELMVVRYLAQGPEQARELRGHGLVVFAVDVVIVVVDECESSALNEAGQVAAFRRREEDGQMAGEEDERIFEQVVGIEAHVHARRRQRQLRVLRERIDHAPREQGRALPVA
jgi:hypothetical protein